MNKLVVIISFLYWFFNVLWDFLQLFSRCYCLSTQQITVDLYFYHFISSTESFQQKETYEAKLMCVTNSKSDVPMYLILLARWTRHILIKCTIPFCEALFPPIFNRSHSLSLPVSPSRFYKVLTGYLLIQIYWPKIRYYRRDFPLSELCATSPRRGLFLHRLACLPLFRDKKQLLKYNTFFYSLDKFWRNNLAINDFNGYRLIGRSRDYLRAVYLGQRIEFHFFPSVILFRARSQ